MAGYDLTIAINSKLSKEAKSFLKFLQNTGRRYPVHTSYRTIKSGEIYMTIDGSDGKIDAFFQELLLNKGLYYYSCAIPSRHEIIRGVIKPIFQQLLESRFERTHAKLLKRHILGKILDPFIPGNLYDATAHKYEMLFRKWDMKLISNYDFIKDLDDLLATFMLEKLEHPVGQRSPKFHELVGKTSKMNLIFDKETKITFNKIHELRTGGLHRLEKNIKSEDVSRLALDVYMYFHYLDEFQESQKEKTIRLNGRRYKRIKYGDEKYLDENGKPYLDDAGNPYNWKEIASSTPCHDCNALIGQYHCFGCDVEQCPRCREQALGCNCDHDE